MNRTIALLLPLIAAVSYISASRGATTTDPAVPAQFWAASVQAETNKDYDEALKQVSSYQQAGGDSFMVSMRTAWLYYLKANYAQAEQFYISASSLKPSALNPVLGLLTVAQATQDKKKVELAGEGVLRLDPTNYRANMALGGVYLADHDYLRALSAYRRVLVSYPDDNDARSGGAWAAYYLGQKSEARDGFWTILTMVPTYPYAQRGFQLASGMNMGGLRGSSLQPSSVQPSSGLQPSGGL